jgi:hypothetical protein
MERRLQSSISLHDTMLGYVVGQFHLHLLPDLSLGAMLDTVVFGVVNSCLLDTRTHQRDTPPPLLLQDRRLSAKMEATCSSEASVFAHLTMTQNKLKSAFLGYMKFFKRNRGKILNYHLARTQPQTPQFALNSKKKNLSRHQAEDLPYVM